MSRAGRQLAVLTAVAAILVAAVLWVGRREYVADRPSLTALAPAAVTRIDLTIPPVPTQAFERRAGGWWRTGPSPGHADAARLERLAQLAESPVARWFPAGGIDLAKVGLEHPSATLVLGADRIEYGGLSAIGELRYVEIGGKVALVPRQYSPEVILTKPDQ